MPEDRCHRRHYLKALGRMAAFGGLGVFTFLTGRRTLRAHKGLADCGGHGICSPCGLLDGCNLPLAVAQRQIDPRFTNPAAGGSRWFRDG